MSQDLGGNKKLMGPLVPNDQSDALHREKGGWSWTMKVHKETKRERGFWVEQQRHTKKQKKKGVLKLNDEGDK